MDGAEEAMATSVPSIVGVNDLHASIFAYADRVTPVAPDGPVSREIGARRRKAIADMAVGSLAQLWRSATTDIDERGIALAAVGSLGRGQPGPFSDLDLLLVHDGHAHKESELASIAEALWYPIWDAGLGLDHAVRSVAKWRAVASQDLPAAVGMLDVRCVAGDEELVAGAATAMLTDWRATARKRLGELVDSAKERAARSGELAYLIEPDLKEARGGIRDAVVLEALASSWLTDRPHGAVDDAMAAILDARDVLQLVTRRRTNRLSLADLDEVAARSGYPEPDDFLASLAEAGRRVAYSLDVTVRRAERALRGPVVSLGPKFVRGRRVAPRLRSIAEGLVEHEGELVLASGMIVEREPLLPLRAAAAAVESGLMLSPVTAENLGRCPAPPEPWSEAGRNDLLALLSSGVKQVPVWEALDLAGVVTRWIPEWTGVRNRLQRAPVHRYTVDRHLIEVVVQMDAPTSGKPVDAGSREWQVRYLSALLHDIGKRSGAADHSVTGAELVPAILHRMGFDDGVIADVQRLVLHHLTLSDLAVHADPSDPRSVEKLAAAVDGRLDLLFTLRDLTRADTSALGERRWTAWRAQLVDDLVDRTAAVLRERGLRAPHQSSNVL